MKFTIITLTVGFLLITCSKAAPQGDVPTSENENLIITDESSSISDQTTETINPDSQSQLDEPSEVTSPKTDESVEQLVSSTEPPILSTSEDSTQTDSIPDEKVDEIKNEVDQINNLIKDESDVEKDTVEIIGNGIKTETELGTAAGNLGTKLGQAALQGTLHIGSLSIDASSDLGKRLMEILKRFGKIMPRPVGEGVQSLANVGDKSIDQLQGLSKQILGNFGMLGHEGLQWINGLVNKGSDITNNIVEKGTGRIQSIIDNRRKQMTALLNSILRRRNLKFQI